MSAGGHSFHKNDWLKVGGGAALAATGLGAAGIGPLAGLFGSAGAGAAGMAGAAGASGIPGGAAGLMGAMTAPTATQAGLLALGAPEAAGTAAGMGGGTASLFGATPGLAADITAPSVALPGAELGSSLDGATPSALSQLQGKLGNMNKAKVFNAMQKMGAQGQQQRPMQAQMPHPQATQPSMAQTGPYELPDWLKKELYG